MTITRRGLWTEIDRLDGEIANLQDAKSECFASYREQLLEDGSKKAAVADEIAACKKAFRRLRALADDADAVLEQDALVDEIVAELQVGTERALARAPRASGAARPEPPSPNAEPPAHRAPVHNGGSDSDREAEFTGGSALDGEPAQLSVAALPQREPDGDTGLGAGSPLKHPVPSGDDCPRQAPPYVPIGPHDPDDPTDIHNMPFHRAPKAEDSGVRA